MLLFSDYNLNLKFYIETDYYFYMAP